MRLPFVTLSAQYGSMPRYDLRRLLKAVGAFGFGVPSTESGALERVDSDEQVELIDKKPLKVSSAPAPVAGFIDGIQSMLCLTYRDRRPVYLYYVAAGGLGPGAAPVAFEERMAVLCSAEDLEWFHSLDTGVPAEPLVGDDPPSLERDAHHRVDSKRDALEASVLHQLLSDTSQGGGLVVVDGGLLGRVRDPRVVGVVKTLRSKYLSDETVIYHLPQGWRSPRFKLGRGGTERYSCYLQLMDKSRGAWNLGLIRLEAWDRDILEPLCARCLAERQVSRHDARWDRHLVSMAATETFLKSNRPGIFTSL